MNTTIPIYEMCPSFEVNRPQIDFELHGFRSEWKELEQDFPEGVDTLPCQFIRFNIEAPNALKWDWYSIAGTAGAISQRAKSLLWPYARGCLRCFATTINDMPYYILRVDEDLALNCLDRHRSVYDVFPHDPERIMWIKKYAFYKDCLADPLIFHVPESHDLLATISIRRIALEANLQGFQFQDVEHLNR